MVARNETFFKWALYGGAALLACVLQGAVLQRIVLWGVFPFLFPMLAAVVGMYEGPLRGSLFGLAVGVVCDLTLTGLLPCTYTLLFPLVGLLSGWIAQSLLPAGFLCSLVAAPSAFALTDLFQCAVLALSGKAAWGAGLLVAGKETLLSLPFLIPVFLLFRAVFRRCHRDD